MRKAIPHVVETCAQSYAPVHGWAFDGCQGWSIWTESENECRLMLNAFGGDAMRRRILLLAFSMAAIALNAMRAAAQTDKPKFKPEELDQMLAPIALYPDSL